MRVAGPFCPGRQDAAANMTAPNLIAFALESAVCAELGLFAVFLLASRAKRSAALYLLAGLSACLAATIGGDLLAGAVGWPWLEDAILFLDLLIPPLVYLYVRQIRAQASRLGPRTLLHAAPAVVGLVLWRSNLVDGMDPYVLLCWMVYLTAAVAALKRHWADYEPAALRRFIGALLSLFAVMVVLRIVLVLTLAPNASFRSGAPFLLILVGAFLATSLILFTALRRPLLLSTPGAERKYADSTADAADLNDLGEKLEALMREHKPYLDPDLDLRALATRLEASPRHLSQLVNTRFGLNVTAYLNCARVTEAAERLTATPDAPIKTVMYDCGFRSKSIFNREFQRWIGKSPSAARASE